MTKLRIVTLPSMAHQQRSAATLDRGFASWIRHFCKDDTWGGLIETTVPDLKRALEDFDEPGTLRLNPEQLLKIAGRDQSISGLLADWDEGPARNRWVRHKSRLALGGIQSRSERNYLFHWMSWLTSRLNGLLAGPAIVRLLRTISRACGKLKGAVAKWYGTMIQKDPSCAKTTAEALLALDVVQVRVQQPNGGYSSKAVLLPTSSASTCGATSA